MQENNVIIEVPMNGQKSKYELKKNDHMHLICQICGTIQDKVITKETQKALIIENFQLKTSQINLYGLCETCQTEV